jgi:hypothetical protein
MRVLPRALCVAIRSTHQRDVRGGETEIPFRRHRFAPLGALGWGRTASPVFPPRAAANERCRRPSPTTLPQLRPSIHRSRADSEMVSRVPTTASWTSTSYEQLAKLLAGRDRGRFSTASKMSCTCSACERLAIRRPSARRRLGPGCRNGGFSRSLRWPDASPIACVDFDFGEIEKAYSSPFLQLRQRVYAAVGARFLTGGRAEEGKRAYPGDPEFGLCFVPKTDRIVPTQCEISAQPPAPLKGEGGKSCR